MVRLTIAELREIMSKSKNIRNVSVTGQVNDCHQSTVIDTLLSKAGILIGEEPSELMKEDSYGPCIIVKPTAFSLYYTLPEKDLKQIVQQREEDVCSFLINLIHSPSHVDFSLEAKSALSITDGALVAVDCISGVDLQTEYLLRQALVDRIRPIVLLDKMDHALDTLQLLPEELYQTLRGIIENINGIISTYVEDDDPMGEVVLDPCKGGVGFGSCSHGWAFTLSHFAEMYATKFKIAPNILMNHLWGDNFYSPAEKKWFKKCAEGSVRGFTQYILDPIYKIYEFCMKKPREEALSLAEKIGVNLTPDEKENTDKRLLKVIMRKWLPAGDTLLQMIIIHLPSPVTAQKYRMEWIYTGPSDSETSLAMKNCDATAPLMMSITKMVPTNDKGRFYAFGRVFSGCIATGMKIRIMGPNYLPHKKDDLFRTTIRRIVSMTGRYADAIENVPCGNICGLVGLDQFLTRSGTITTFENAHSMKMMKLSAVPIVRVLVDCKNPADLPRLIAGLKYLAKADPLVHCTVEESGTHIIAGSSEVHLKTSFNELEEEYACVPLTVSEPIVSYRETVSKESDRICMAKSPNKRNRIYMKAIPQLEELTDDIEKGRVTVLDKEERARYLTEKYGYDQMDARKIWCFGPDGTGPNVLVDLSKDVKNINEIKDSVVAGFNIATEEGVLCEESMRGVRFNIHDASLWANAIERKPGQIIAMTRRSIFAATLVAQPRLLEPVYAVEIQGLQVALCQIDDILSERRGYVFEKNQLGCKMGIIKAYLPVSESFGFTDDLYTATSGQVFSHLCFDHWQILAGDPLDPTSKPGAVVTEIRKRKGLRDTIPSLDAFTDTTL